MISFFKPSISLTFAVLTVLSLGITQVNAMMNQEEVDQLYAFLLEHKSNPETVALKIQELFSEQTLFIVGDMLTTALDRAGVTIESISSDSDKTVLHYACIKGYTQCLQVAILLAKNPFNFVMSCDKDRCTPLHDAVQHKRIKEAEILLKGGNIDLLLQATNVAGQTPFDIARHLDDDDEMFALLHKYRNSAKL